MSETATLDARGLKCPMPIVKAKKALEAQPVGGELRVVATDPGSVLDFQGWAKVSTLVELVRQEEAADEQGRRTFIHVIRRKA